MFTVVTYRKLTTYKTYEVSRNRIDYNCLKGTWTSSSLSPLRDGNSPSAPKTPRPSLGHFPHLFLTAQPCGPVAHPSNGIKAETLRTCVLPPQRLPVLHFGTRDELPAGSGVGEVALIQAFNDTGTVKQHLAVLRDLADVSMVALVVVVVAFSQVTGRVHYLLEGLRRGGSHYVVHCGEEVRCWSGRGHPEAWEGCHCRCADCSIVCQRFTFNKNVKSYFCDFYASGYGEAEVWTFMASLHGKPHFLL